MHISHDAWVEDDKLDLPMARMPEAELQRCGLPADGGCDWWAAEVDVLPYGVVLDFVFSDSALRAWDNNGQQARALQACTCRLFLACGSPFQHLGQPWAAGAAPPAFTILPCFLATAGSPNPAS